MVVGDIHAGALTSLISYTSQIVGSLAMLSFISISIGMARVSFGRIAEILGEVPDIQGPESDLKVEDGGIVFDHVSFSYTRSKEIKPDLAAPGVRVSAVNKNGNLTAVTGSSAAAAITAGAAALLINWRLNGKPRHLMTSSELKNFLIRGAGRSRDLTYPNRSWGYGTLNVYGVFESLL